MAHFVCSSAVELNCGKIEWCCGIKSFTYGYFPVLRKAVEYFLVKVVPKDLVKQFFDKGI